MINPDNRSDIHLWSCPIPLDQYPVVVMAHGGGGKLMNQLIEQMFVRSFSNPFLNDRQDSAIIPWQSGELAFTTDSFVVHPLFFPGGNIGDLAVNGTVNDLAVSGARPMYLSVGLILEEGLPMETLWKVIQTMQAAAEKAGVTIVTGDTKVVERGKGDGIYINTTGIGKIIRNVSLKHIQPGDRVILSNDIGRHGMAVMAAREGLQFESAIESDTAPLSPVIMDLMESGIQVRCMRDATRGGLASVLVELAETAQHTFLIREADIPVRDDVMAACEILGMDPLYVANEGCMVLIVSHDDAERAVNLIRRYDTGKNAVVIGEVLPYNTAPVIMNSRIGSKRIIDLISGEQLPRIC